MSLKDKLKTLGSAVGGGVDVLYDGLNQPDYNKPPVLGGDSMEATNWLIIGILVAVGGSIALGVFCDQTFRFSWMQGRPKYWAIFLIFVSYLLLIPGLTRPLFSFSVVINVIGHRKAIEPDGHEVCTETTTGLAHLLWRTGSKIGAFFVVTFGMVIPAIELVMLMVGETFRFGSDGCARIFRAVIIWVQHRSKWASPDMFAYVLLIHLVRSLDNEPLVLTRARLDIGFSCFSVFCVTATVASLGVPLPKPPATDSSTPPAAPWILCCVGQRGVAIVTLVLAALFLPVFVAGLFTPCMALRIDQKQLFPPYGPLPESARPAVDLLDLPKLLSSDTSVWSCMVTMVLRLADGELNTVLSLLLISIFAVGFTFIDMVLLVMAALRYGLNSSGYSELVEAATTCVPHRCPLMSLSRTVKKLAMLDVLCVGIYLVTVCMAIYQKYGVEVKVQRGVFVLLAAEFLHWVTYYVVDSVVGYGEQMADNSSRSMKQQELQDDEESERRANQDACGLGCYGSKGGLWGQQLTTA